MYTLRVLLTGLHLMRTGEVVADLRDLHEGWHLPYVPELIAAKRAAGHGLFPGHVRAALERDVPRLRAALEAARDSSHLPAVPGAAATAVLHDLVVRLRPAW